MNRFMPRSMPRAGLSHDAPIAVWLHIGPNSRASVCVSFPGTTKSFVLTRVQARRLQRALEEGNGIIARDEGDLDRSVSVNLLEGVE